MPARCSILPDGGALAHASEARRAAEGGPGPDRSPVAKMAIVWRSRPLVGRGLSTNHGAEVAEQADATVSKTVEGNLVRVQLPASAPIQSQEPP